MYFICFWKKTFFVPCNLHKKQQKALQIAWSVGISHQNFTKQSRSSFLKFSKFDQSQDRFTKNEQGKDVRSKPEKPRKENCLRLTSERNFRMHTGSQVTSQRETALRRQATFCPWPLASRSESPLSKCVCAQASYSYVISSWKARSWNKNQIQVGPALSEYG